MSDRMAERDRAKRQLLLRMAVYVALPIASFAAVWLLAGALWGLAGLVVGVVVAGGVAARMHG